MPKEIERKFLVTNDNWKQHINHQSHYLQGYLNNNQSNSIRIRITDEQANLNIKSATLGIIRDEYDYQIPLDEAKEMLDKLCEQPIIEKTRYFVEDNDVTWEIDVFERENAGLIVAELELQSVEQSFIKPDWVGEDVSDDPRYYNACLATYPYKNWPKN